MTKEINIWHQVNRDRYERADGAVVKYDLDSPYPNPENESARMWTAWEPNPSNRYLKVIRYGRQIRNWPKRWKIPENAMHAVDQLFPYIRLP